VPLENPAISLAQFFYENYCSKEVFAKNPPAAIGLWVGPEGGFSPNELAALLHAGAIPITLGKRVLRTETAGLAALALIHGLAEFYFSKGDKS
jgi:RsmE family RNA methyltransferase